MVLHDLNLAVRYSHRIIAIKQGTIYQQDSVRGIMTEKLIKEVFDVDAEILEDKMNHCPYFIPNKALEKN
jgi:iron complex transport system ATP-binding protein